MELLFGCGLALLEMTFIFVGLLIFHGLRKVIGYSPFYIALGALFVFLQLVGTVGLRISPGIPGFDLEISTGILLLPILVSLLVVYLADGTLETQRLMIGLMAALGIYAYLAHLTGAQISWGRTFFMNDSSEVLSSMMTDSIRQMAAMVIAFTLAIFLLPIFFQRLRNMKMPMMISICISLVVVQAVDSVVFASVCYWGEPRWWSGIFSSCVGRAVLSLWLGVIASYYLSRIDLESPGRGRRTLDIIIAFFGTYGRAKALEQDLKQTEERYRLLVQNAADMILVMDRNGSIAECNDAAVRMLGVSREDLNHQPFQMFTDTEKNIWSGLYTEKENGEIAATAGDDGEKISVQCSCCAKNTRAQIDLTLSAVMISGEPMVIVFGHDVTERLRFEKEREELRTQISHSQRLESIGRLAGGIAHDFNNYLQAIQGNLDMIQYMHPVEDDDVNRYLGKIDKITSKAAVLTQQLLGFARKGNYNEMDLSLKDLVDSAVELFMPDASSLCTVQVMDPPAGEEDLMIRGDLIQLQQTLLNIMFNARYAMRDIPEQERIIRIVYGSTRSLRIPFNPPSEAKIMAGRNYCAISIQDRGPGIPEAALNRIFEPFYTTKPIGEGTGMGLSMAYGTMLSHKGWIQCRNAEEGGAVFSLIFPIRDEAAGKEGLHIEDNIRMMGV